MADAGVGLGSFASGMAGGLQMGDSIKRAREEQDRLEEDSKRQQEEDRRRREEERQNQQQQQGPNLSQLAQLKSMAGAGGEANALSGSSSAAAGSGEGVGAMGMPTSYSAYAGGSAGAGAGGAGAGAGAAAGGGSGSAAAGTGVAASGPWGWIAAAVAANEISAHNGGYRRNGWQGVKDLVGGKVMEQDANQRFSKYLGGYDDDKTGLMNDAGAFQEFATLDFKNGAKKITDHGTLNRIGSGLKKLFS